MAVTTGRIDVLAEHRGETDGQDVAVRLQDALFRGRELIEYTLSMSLREAAGAADLVPVTYTGRSELADVVAQTLGRSGRDIAVVLTETGELSDAILGNLDRVPPGPSVWVLCTASAADAYADRLSCFQRRPNTEIRVADRELQAALVVDGAVAVVSGAEAESGTAESGRDAAVISDADTVQALELLFTCAWAGRPRLNDHLHLGPRLRSELGRNVLRQLCSGITDEAAAQDLAVSLRTYRRCVADIMRELNAGTRFQVGVQAVEFGLLST